MTVPDGDVLLQQQDEGELCVLHPGPVHQVQHVRGEEEDEAEQHELGGVLQGAA